MVFILVSTGIQSDAISRDPRQIPWGLGLLYSHSRTPVHMYPTQWHNYNRIIEHHHRPNRVSHYA
jgi:hypothetical protein